MSRQTRTLLITFAVAMVGLTALWLMAERYRKLLEQAPVSSPSVAPVTTGETGADVEARFQRFVKIRTEIRAVVERARAGSERPPDATRLMNEIASRKNELLAETGMGPEEYEEIRAARAIWLGGGEIDAELAALFEAHRDDLAALDLGELEDLDSIAGV
ncbi:MAG: hypothetical protein R3344_10850 [Acidobacteriota bacterium]|nr:hypothetical protein [Acidobacteriota bacterium]